MADKREPLITGDDDASIPMLPRAPEPASGHRIKRAKPLTLLPLVALIFYDVSGGPFGIEVSHQSLLQPPAPSRTHPYPPLPSVSEGLIAPAPAPLHSVVQAQPS